MTKNLRIMDVQQDLAERFYRLSENIKKEPIPRRTAERQERYEQERCLLWEKIASNHTLLMEAEPPQEYIDKYSDLVEINEQILARLSSWILKSNIPPSYSDDPKLSQDNDKPNMSEQRFELSDEPIASQDQTNESEQTYEPQSNNPSFENPSALFWNRLMAEQRSSNENVERMFMMLAENQLQHLGPKPPEVKVQPFNGDFNKYVEFRETYNRSLRNTKHWTEADKFLYLKTLLTGEALLAVQNFPRDHLSHALAWGVLERKFNNKRKLLSKTISPYLDSSVKVEYGNVESLKKLVNIIQCSVASIKQLQSTPEEILMHMIVPQLDHMSRSKFEDFLGPSTITPTINQIIDFFDKEQGIWESSPTKSLSATPKNKLAITKVNLTSDTKIDLKCYLCNKDHSVIDCDQLLKSADRVQLLKQNRLCVFCGKHKYVYGRPCKSKSQLHCEKEGCGKHHHTLLHPASEGATTTTMLTRELDKVDTVLPTAIAHVLDSYNTPHTVRCLIDLCAERSYVSEDIAQKLRLKKHKAAVTIAGINGITGRANAFVNLEIQVDNPAVKNITTQALVVPKITGALPKPTLSKVLETKFKLADPPNTHRSVIGVLLGGDIASQLFQEGIPNHVTSNGLLLQPTHLGWIVSGNSPKNVQNYVSTFITTTENIECLSKDDDLTKRIIDFYELPEQDMLTSTDDAFCEKLFQEKHYRLSDGRYVVPMPWISDKKPLGQSYNKALQMFFGQERKWNKDPDHYNMSNDFMENYEALGHMSRVVKSNEKSRDSNIFYIPYMSVIRKGALTTKLRNVFNASMPSSNGLSLNDTMHEGPKLQTLIKDILITARSYRYIYSADISMMFRQILILPEDRQKLRIIWRPSKYEPLREYELNTITYGTDAAPFLAIRTIQQCADDNASSDIATIIKKAFYVDDLLYGADSITEAQTQVYEINKALLAGQFPLTKWMSNCEETLKDIPAKDKICSFMTEGSTEMKILGAPYDFDTDDLCFRLKETNDFKNTKRGISAAAASFYDPLGLILPLIMMLRIFLQRVWQLKVEWDEPLTETIRHQFHKCIENITSLNTIRIQRFLPCDNENCLDLIGFADASTHAQAAVIYCRTKIEKGYNVILLASKGNVSKVKSEAIIESKQQTIPKLELEALLTLANLFKSIINSLSHRNIRFTAYTDSKVALAWVRNSKLKDKKFIERRVNKIKSIFHPSQLHYVRSEENPADPASRGLTATQLADCSIWFHGPSWLQDDELPTTPFDTPVSQTFTVIHDNDDMFLSISNWAKLLRVTAQCLRWKHKPLQKWITASEITQARKRVIYYYQRQHLHDALERLTKGELVQKKHWLYSLSPFIDNDNLLRVGGRLANSQDISSNQKQPLVFPKSHGLQLLIADIHLRNGHAGNSLLTRLLIENYWITAIRKTIQSITRKCTTCIRWSAKSIQPEMSQLPEARVTIGNTFDKVGVDLSGPFLIKASHLRSSKKMKVWVVNFVCLATKAVHLDLVSSLSTEHFLAAFGRFCSRRGTSSEIWSDNGTNFVGANRAIKETWQKILQDSEKQTAIQEITWKFIPRHSPTFGGLWEACVKSLKYFVKRMSAVQNLTYEEFYTLISHVEALLNSRPLFPNPLSPNDEPALTPYHFINQKGYRPSVITENSLKIPLTKKWFLINQVREQYWDRFRTEYLRELQTKRKWQRPQPNLELNDIVLIKEPSLTPGDWRMGKITKTYPDPQGIVRKVNVMTSNKNISLHACNRLVPLLKSDQLPETQITCNEQQSNNQKSTKVIQKTRRNPRTPKTITLLQLCLITLVTLCPGINANNFETLSSGVHVKNVETLFSKKFEVKFTVSTGLNLTQDLYLINATIQDFHDECHRAKDVYPTAFTTCREIESAIVTNGHQLAHELSNSYRPKIKRWVSGAIKGITKFGPYVLAGAGYSYQAYQIHDLENKHQETKDTIRQTINAIFKTELQYEQVSGKLNDVIHQQQQIAFDDSLNSYAQEIDLLFQRLRNKHEDIINIKPLAELQKFVEPLLTSMPNIMLPKIGIDIFDIYRPSKFIENDVTTISFTIPMVSTDILTNWLLISIPDDFGSRTSLPNHNSTYKVITNVAMTRSMNTADTHKIHPRIIEETSLKPIDECLWSLLNHKNTNPSCPKETVTANSTMVQLTEDLTLVEPNNDHETEMSCQNNETRIIQTPTLVNISQCSLVSQERAIWRNFERAAIYQDPEDVPKHHAYDSINELTTVEPTVWSFNLNELSSNLSSNGQLIYVITAAAILILFIIIIGSCNRQPQRWVPNWDGPMVVSTST